MAAEPTDIKGMSKDEAAKDAATLTAKDAATWASKGVAMDAVPLIDHEHSLKEWEKNAPVNKAELIVPIILGFGWSVF